MLTSKSEIDISAELVVQRWNKGVRLIKPDTKTTGAQTTLAALVKKNLNFYISDTNSILHLINKKTAMTCGYLSEKDARGKSIRNIAKADTSNSIIHNDCHVVKTKIFNIREESFTRLNDIKLTAISIKFPLFNDTKVIGILGCSILTDSSMANSFSILMETGLLNASSHLTLPGSNFHGTYFSEIETKILIHTIRSKTAKEIAKILGYSSRTIEHRLEKIKMKADVSSKAELIDKMFDKFKE